MSTAPLDVAFTTLHTKTGKGRDTRTKARAKSVEDEVCRSAFRDLPAINHELTNGIKGETYCRHCLASWSMLDAEVRTA